MRFKITDNAEAVWSRVESDLTGLLQLGKRFESRLSCGGGLVSEQVVIAGTLGANGAALRVPLPRRSLEALNLSNGIDVFVFAQLAAGYECLR
jgi:hypothetical protein